MTCRCCGNPECRPVWIKGVEEPLCLDSRLRMMRLYDYASARLTKQMEELLDVWDRYEEVAGDRKLFSITKGLAEIGLFSREQP